MIYATQSQLESWLDSAAPEGAAALLRSASALVAEATLCDVYPVDPSGVAVDQGVADALSDATCAQAATWLALGVNPSAGAAGAPAVVSSSSVLSGSVSYSLWAGQAEARARSAETLCADAYAILRASGLASAYVWGRA